MQIKITGIGIVSAIGNNVAQNLSSLKTEKSGLGLPTLFRTIHNVPVGEVKLTNSQLVEMLSLSADSIYSRTSLLGIKAASEAVNDAKIDKELRIGLISATSVGGMDLTERFYEEFIKDDGSVDINPVSQHPSAVSTKQIADYCGIKDFSTTISTACSSAANAIMFGARLLEAGILDVAVAGGTDSLCKFTLNGFKSLMILDGQECRPFDESRAGLNLGEGAGYLVMMRDETPSEKNYGYLRGFANANDAHHQTATSELGDGAYISMFNALQMANISADMIDYVNVHGTGTGNNDSSEANALIRIFGDSVPKFSSTKPYTGHTLAAAGGIEAVFSLLSLNNNFVAPNLNFKEPINEIRLLPETKYSENNKIDYVMSNSFGFGGNCSTLIFASSSGCQNNSIRNTVYVNAVSTDSTLSTDIKELIADANLRRRMSKIVKQGVSVGMECIKNSGVVEVDGIVTATGLGCLEDSEKFLRTLIVNEENMLNPTPFIQSTFNTVGGQIALLCKNHCYNMTYTHTCKSFEAALLDAVLLLQEGKCKNVLVGAFEQNIEIEIKVLHHLGMYEDSLPKEGACFLMLSTQKSDKTISEIDVDTIIEMIRNNEYEPVSCMDSAYRYVHSILQ